MQIYGGFVQEIFSRLTNTSNLSGTILNRKWSRTSPETSRSVKLTGTVHISLIGKANAALARYDGLLQGIINPEILLSPLTIREAVLSSRIEGTQASLEDVLQFEADETHIITPEKRLDIQEIIN
jgi:Fic family protein